jgi:hypothetical protein
MFEPRKNIQKLGCFFYFFNQRLVRRWLEKRGKRDCPEMLLRKRSVGGRQRRAGEKSLIERDTRLQRGKFP